jgi:hypothetical protein
MASARRLYLLPLAALCGLPLAAEDGNEKKTCHWHSHSDFGAYAQINAPLRDLKDALDRRTGFGIGLQWIHDHGEHHASRTRIEYNVFPEGNPVGEAGTRTYAKNYLLSFDHLFQMNSGPTNVYLVTGLGGIRWKVDETTAGHTNSLATTKLALAGGIGIQIRKNVNLETRYVVSGIHKTFDSNMVQASVGWRI